MSRRFRGVPGEEPEPTALADALARVGKELGLSDPRVLKKLTDCWPEIVGEQLAQQATLRSLRDDTMTIAVDSGAWATQLRYLESDIIRRTTEVLGATMGRSAVRHVRIVVEARE